MAGTAGSLAAAISGADGRLTVLDDRIDAEDQAAFLWMRAHQLHGHGHDRVVIGTEALSDGWNDRKKKFTSVQSGEAYLHPFLRSHASMVSLQRIASSLSAPLAHAPSAAETITAVATALYSGRAWLIELPKRNVKSRNITKTDPKAFAPINPRYGTSVDFAYIAKLEGDQWLRGYVPMKDGVVAGRSGMTVGSGFDIGQWTPEELDDLGLPDALLDKIEDFAAPNNFKGLTRVQVVARVGKIGPVPQLNKTEADLCDGAVFGKILGDAIKAWDSGRKHGVPSFTQLPAGWQTVWLSRVYQEGAHTKIHDAIVFRNAARAGDWQGAISALRAYKKYTERATQEAGLLAQKLPASPPPANPKAAPRNP